MFNVYISYCFSRDRSEPIVDGNFGKGNLLISKGFSRENLFGIPMRISKRYPPEMGTIVHLFHSIFTSKIIIIIHIFANFWQTVFLDRRLFGPSNSIRFFFSLNSLSSHSSWYDGDSLIRPYRTDARVFFARSITLFFFIILHTRRRSRIINTVYHRFPLWRGVKRGWYDFSLKILLSTFEVVGRGDGVFYWQFLPIKYPTSAPNYLKYWP